MSVPLKAKTYGDMVSVRARWDHFRVLGGLIERWVTRVKRNLPRYVK